MTELVAALVEFLGDGFIPLLIIALTIIFGKFIHRVLEKKYKKSIPFSPAERTDMVFLKHFSTFAIAIIGLFLVANSIPALHAFSVSIFAGAGVLAVIIGFASQQAFANIMSGVFITMFKPFRVGDLIKIKSDIIGIVEDITLRHTVIRSFENKKIIIPNAVISNEIIENAGLGDEKICKFIDVNISYDSNIDNAMRIMQEESVRHPYFLDNRNHDEKKQNLPPVIVRVMGFGDSGINLRAWVWAKYPNAAFIMGCDLHKTIKERFDKEGIEISYPYRAIVYKNYNPPKIQEKIHKTKKR